MNAMSALEIKMINLMLSTGQLHPNCVHGDPVTRSGRDLTNDPSIASKRSLFTGVSTVSLVHG